jgi:hypothetical protein
MLTRQISRSCFSLALAMVVALLAVAPALASEPRLPNIVADPPNNVTLETSTTEGGLKGSGEAKLLLRFNGYIHNVGPGALDIRGWRSNSNEQMKAFQRVYNSDGSYNDEPSAAELEYVKADGHEHWHLQRAARYSLWYSGKNAEVAPAQKVGFCLDDSEHVEPIGPSEAVYSDATGREFCRQHQPLATSLFEGVSAGWRDLYRSNLAYQWVDASSVLPGEYWLREDVNTTGVIKETGGANAPAYATSPTIIPGFNALAQAAGTPAGKPVTITLSSKAWKDSNTPKYAVASQPQHGSLSAVSGNQVKYTPEAGYYGSDSFNFVAYDSSSPFPRSPAVATVAIDVGAGQNPSVAIEGSPSSMIVATAVQLGALVQNDDPTSVTWSASAGSITPGGLYTAPSEPPTGGAAVITAHTSRGAQAQATINIVPVPPAEPLPVAGPSPTAPAGLGGAPGGAALGESSSHPPPIFKPAALLVGRRLVLTTKVTEAGRVRLSAFLRGHRLGTCAILTPADRSFTCRLTLAKTVSLSARISVLASLRVGSTILSSLRPAAPVPRMSMKSTTPFHTGASAALASGQYWCGPLME